MRETLGGDPSGAVTPGGLEDLTRLLDRFTPVDGITSTPLDEFALYRTSVDLPRQPELEAPAIVVLVQGTKVCHYGEVTRRYVGPRVVVGLFPAPVETEFLDTAPDRPFLAVGVRLDPRRLAETVVRLDELEEHPAPPTRAEATAKLSLALSADLAEPFLRLLRMLARPRDLRMLGAAAVEEVYYRLLTGPRGPALRALLEQSGRVRRIEKAVQHIHANLDEPVSVPDLAAMVHMSRTAFFRAFREVLGASPLQYAKSVKLLEARRRIQEGLRVSEAAYLVGYANLGQFSREYKRQFGHPPSATR